MELETERLILRTIIKEDIEDIFEYSKEPNVGPNAGWKPHETIEETAGIANAIFVNQRDIFGIELKENHKLIGTIGVMNDPKRENYKAKMLGYAMSEKYWGKGIMTEASKAVIKYCFETIKVDLISAYCYPDNIGSKRIFEKNGFEYEGTLKQAERRYDDVVLDNECYILLKEKYFNK